MAVFGLLIVMSTDPIEPRHLVPFGYVALIIGLSYGVARRSRVAAASLLATVLLMEGAMVWRTGSLLSAATILFFCPLYLRGLRGALEWHRLERQRRRSELYAQQVAPIEIPP